MSESGILPPASGGVLARSRAGRSEVPPNSDRYATLAASLPDLAEEPQTSGAAMPSVVPVATEEIVVLDYGGQYSQLIARRVRDCGVFSELLPHHVGLEEIVARRPRGIILSGGPASGYAEGAPRLD